MRISIDGNIGTGKTFYLKKLEEEGYIVNHENTNKWRNWLEKYGNDMKRFALGFQLQILLDQNNMPYEDKKINLYERSPYTLKNVFGDMLFEDNLFDPDEYKLHNNYIDQFGWKPDVIIYLYCDPDICHRRIDKRTDIYGDNKLTSEYIKKLHLKHETVFDELNCSIQIYKINSQEDTDTVFKNIKDILNKEYEKNLKIHI